MNSLCVNCLLSDELKNVTKVCLLKSIILMIVHVSFISDQWFVLVFIVNSMNWLKSAQNVKGILELKEEGRWLITLF